MGNNVSSEEPFRAQPGASEAGRVVFLLWLAHRYWSNVIDAAKGGTTLERSKHRKNKRRNSNSSFGSEFDDNTSR